MEADCYTIHIKQTEGTSIQTWQVFFFKFELKFIKMTVSDHMNPIIHIYETRPHNLYMG